MAGKEKRGAENADAELFRDRPYVLTASPASPASEALLYWLQQFGARIVELDADLHDRAVALASHLPQICSTSLALTLSEFAQLPVVEICGSGLLDMTRLAQSSPELWTGILETNRDQVVSAIDHFVQRLNRIRNSIGDSELANIFDEANTYAYSLRNKR